MPHKKLYSVAFFWAQKRCNQNTLSQSLTSNSVQEHEVLEIGDLAALPLLRHVWVAHELARRHHRRPSVNNNTHFNDYVFDSTNQDNWTETCFFKETLRRLEEDEDVGKLVGIQENQNKGSESYGNKKQIWLIC